MNTTKITVLATILLVVFFNFAQAQTVIDEIENNSQTSQFAQALKKAGLADQFDGPGPFTIFAPSNTAFQNLSIRQQTDKNLLLNHVLTGMATKRNLNIMNHITCLSGKSVEIEHAARRLTVENITILESNIRADNGVIHIIDGVIK